MAGSGGLPRNGASQLGLERCVGVARLKGEGECSGWREWQVQRPGGRTGERSLRGGVTRGGGVGGGQGPGARGTEHRLPSCWALSPEP